MLPLKIDIMKPLEELTNTDKAKIIHQLFPEEIPLLLDDILAFCKDFRERKEEFKNSWSEHSIVSFEYWQALSIETEKLITRLRFNMVRSYHVFGDQLSYSHSVFFFNDRLVKYAEKVSTNEKFKLAVSLFYLP